MTCKKNNVIQKVEKVTDYVQIMYIGQYTGNCEKSNNNTKDS